MEAEGETQVHPVCILDKRIKVLRNRSIWSVKVQWTHNSPKEANWELEDKMREEYPHIFFTTVYVIKFSKM